MFGFVVWQIHFSESLSQKFGVRGLTSVRSLTMKAKIQRLKYIRSPQSKVWKLMSKVHNRKFDVRSRTKSEVWWPTSVRSLKTVWIMSKVWSTMYVCSKSGVRKPKSEVQSLSEVQNPSLKPKSEVCQLSEVWSRSPESNAQNSKSAVESLKSEVCLKSVQSLSKVWNLPMSEVLCPKYYVQSLSEVWLQTTKFWSLKLPAKFKQAEKSRGKKINQSVVIKK